MTQNEFSTWFRRIQEMRRTGSLYGYVWNTARPRQFQLGGIINRSCVFVFAYAIVNSPHGWYRVTEDGNGCECCVPLRHFDEIALGDQLQFRDHPERHRALYRDTMTGVYGVIALYEVAEITPDTCHVWELSPDTLN